MPGIVSFVLWDMLYLVMAILELIVLRKRQISALFILEQET